MIILFGPSASGKTEVAKMLQFKYDIKKVITCTTRNKRLGEQDGVDYYFLTEQEILKEYNDSLLVEMTRYNDCFYGTRVSEIRDDKAIILDPNGVASFQKLNQKKIITFYLYASEVTRFNRMICRQDSIEKAHQRIENDKIIFDKKNLPRYDYLMNTDKITIEEATDKIYEKYLDLLHKFK